MSKKLLFFIESLEVGGAERSLVTLLNSARFENYAVDLMMLREGTFLVDVPPHINVIILNSLKPSIFKRFKFYFLNKIYSPELHSSQNFWKVFHNDFERINEEYDVAIAYSQGFSTYFVDKKIEAKKKYAWVNIDYKKAGYDIKFDYPFYKKFNKIVAVSKDVRDGLSTELQKIEKDLSIEVIKDITNHKSIWNQSLKALDFDFNDKVINIVTVCRLVKQKGLFLAIESCALLVKNNYKINWYVVGEGSERRNLEQQIKNTNLQDCFFLLGAKTNPYSYMKACDIYVQTSLFEGLGLTIIEASYLNKPVVSTNFPTVHDILVDEKTGLIAEMNAESIADQVERLINNPDLREFLVSNLIKQENSDKEISLAKINKLLSE